MTEPSKDAQKKKKHSDSSRFDTFILRVLRQVHPDTGITGDGLAALNNIMHNTLRELMLAVNNLMFNGGRKTLSSREVLFALVLKFPGELRSHAIKEANKALKKYEDAKEAHKGTKGNPVSRSIMAGLQFPVTRVQRLMMKLSTSDRKSDTAAVCMAAALEYVCAELLELAGNTSRDYKKHRINPRFIMIGIRNDHELNSLFRNTVLSGGVLPDKSLPKALDTKPKKTQKKKAAEPKPEKSKAPAKAKNTKAPAKGKAPAKAKNTKAPAKGKKAN